MIFQSMKMAWHAVVSNKLRSFLTMLGIIIGVVALIVLVSIANGATSSVTDQISSMGSSYLTVIITDDKGNPLRLKELSDFCEPEEVDEVAPVSWTSVTAKTSYSNGTMTLTGTTGSYADIQGLELFSGRFLKQTDIDNNSYVVVITKDTATELLGRVDAVGESIKLNGKSFLVVGVLSDSTSLTQGAAVTSSSDSDDSDSSSSSVQLEGYIPFSTMTRLADNVLDVTMFYASGTDEDSLEPAENALTELLMERFGEDEDAFSIVDQSEIMEAMSSVTNTMSLMIGGIAAISLLVGGIGIMNIMLVSVTERTREIGIRKAIGAGRETIMLQFLIEALLVSLMGCLAGIGLSWVILKVAAVVMKNSMSFTMDAKALELADGFIVRVGGHIPIQEDGPDGVPHPVPEIPQLEKTGAHCQQAAGAKQQRQPHRPPYHTADHRIHPRQALPHTQTPPVLYCMAQGAFSCPGSGFCIKKRIPAHPVPKRNGGTRDAQERLEALLGGFGGGTSGAAAAGGRHSPAHPADGAHPYPDRPAPERGAHPVTPGRAPDDSASLHRRGAAGLFAGLPERRPEQPEPAGRAGGADRALQRRDCQSCPLLRSGGARPVPSGASGGAGPAGGYALSGAVPRRAGKNRFPLRAGAGGVFGGTDCR